MRQASHAHGCAPMLRHTFISFISYRKGGKMDTSEKFRMVAAVCAMIASLTVPAPARIVYVDAKAVGANSGSSWDDPCRYLQWALTVAVAGDEVRVAQGVYRPDQGLPSVSTRSRLATTTPPEAVFQLKNGVTILGGFAGIGADDPNARDVECYKTVLSGDLHGNDVDLWGPGNPVYESLRADNNRHVIQSIGVDATAVLDGFVIESATDSDFFNQAGSPRIANCVFQKGSTPNSGGALRCEGGHPTLTNCEFQGNSSTNSQGGAIDIQGGQLTLSNCRFLGNWAWQEGGAICCADGDLTLTQCAFEKNAGSIGGALYQAAGKLTLTDCRFEDNAANSGGAVWFDAEVVSLTRCTFVKNWAVTMGGAVVNEGGAAPTFEGCTFTANAANGGGAIYAMRIVVPAPGPGMTLSHCLFTGNRAWDTGGALFDDGVGFAVRNCTFTGNGAQMGETLAWRDGRAGAAYHASLDNCIVWDGAGSIQRVGMASRGQTSKGDVLVHYCDVQGGSAGEGNINIDPCFVVPGRWVEADNPEVVVPPLLSEAVWIDGDCHLKSQVGRSNPVAATWVLDDVSSPCIDAGDPADPFGDEPLPNGGRINLGVYGGTAEASKSCEATGRVAE
jgi:hypothetical protein